MPLAVPATVHPLLRSNRLRMYRPVLPPTEGASVGRWCIRTAPLGSTSFAFHCTHGANRPSAGQFAGYPPASAIFRFGRTAAQPRRPNSDSLQDDSADREHVWASKRRVGCGLRQQSRPLRLAPGSVAPPSGRGRRRNHLL